MSIYFYAETAFHHEGDFDYLIGLIDAAKEAGANGVKFQVLMDIDNLTSSRHSLYPKLKSCIFSKEQWQEAFRHCAENALDVVMMPLDKESFELIEPGQTQVRYLDLHSVSFYDDVILDGIKNSGIPLIIGVGGRTIDEINAKRDFFGEQFEVIMVGFQSYPSKLEDIKLERIRYFSKLFPGMEIGYADHSSYDSELAIKSNEYAYLLGARFFEKHLTVDQGKERLDFQSALGKEGVEQLVQNLMYLDTSVFRYSENELRELADVEMNYRNRQKVAVARQDLKSGDLVSEESIVFKMTESGKGEQSSENIVGKALVSDVPKDEAILRSDVA